MDNFYPSFTSYMIAHLDLGVLRHYATSCDIFAYPSANIGAAMWQVSFSPVLLFHIIHDTNSPPRHQDDIRATLDDIYTTLDDTFFHTNFATFFAEELLFTFSILPYDI